MKKSNTKDYSFLIMFIPMFFVLMPRPDIAGIQFLTYPAIVFVIAVMIFNMTKDIKINKNVFLVMVFLFLITFSMVFSMMLNGNLNIDSIAKPILFGSLVYFGYFVNKGKDAEVIKNSLRRLAYIVIFIQLIVGMTQLFGIDVFGILYSMEKTRAWGSIVRIAGTMANPNIFSWVLIIMSVNIWLFERKTFKKLFWVGIALCLVFLSGSRSMLLMFPLSILFVEIFTQKKSAVFYFIKVPFYSALLFGAYHFAIWFLTKYETQFPYMSQLLSIIETGELDSINSFDHRQFMWERALSNINSEWQWIFGTGGMVDKADSDYVFSIANFGIFYVILQLSMYLLIAYFFFKLKDKKIKALGIQYILFSLIIGYQAETLSGWNYPIFIMFYTGIAISILATNNVPEVAKETIKNKRKRYKLVW